MDVEALFGEECSRGEGWGGSDLLVDEGKWSMVKPAQPGAKWQVNKPTHDWQNT